MSQYPSPYYPPNVQPPYLPYGQQADVMGPARRASTMMFILGGLLLALGVCDILQSLAIPLDQQIQRARQMPGAMQGAQLDDQVLKTFLIGVPVFLTVVGIVHILLGVGVRRGGRKSTILSLVLTASILAVLVVMSLLMVIASLQVPMALLFTCMLLMPVALLIPLTIWLIGALRAMPQMARAQQQYLAQYWQYQQNMQAYSGYGYAAPPQEGQPYQPAPPQPPALPADDSTTTPPTNG